MSGADLPKSVQGSHPEPGPEGSPEAPAGLLARAAGRFTGWAERSIPDAFVFALVATVLVAIAAAAEIAKTSGPAETAGKVVEIWGSGFWELLPFTLQMALVIVFGYVVATSRPVYRAIAALASLPRSPRSAVAMVALFAMLSSWLNWGFSLIFSAMLAKETARRVRGVDYRAIAAASFLGLGSIWAQGLSGSAALQMASASSMQPAVRQVVEAGGLVPGGVIPLTSTIFLWQSLVSVALEIVLVVPLVYATAPEGVRARSATQLGIDLGTSPLERSEPGAARTRAEWLEHSPILSLAFVLLAGGYLARTFATSKQLLDALSLNTINLIFMTAGVLLHWTPARLMRAVREATPSVWGVILQFPLYAGIAALIVRSHLNERIAAWFVGISTPRTFPAVIAVYSAVLGIFVPSGGSKWVIEAPYVMKAAHDHHVHLGWMVAVYDLGEALANLLQPFWMLPVLGLFGLRARDVMGHTFLVALVLFPLVLVLVTVLGATLSYPL